MTTCRRLLSSQHSRPVTGPGIPPHDVGLVASHYWEAILRCIMAEAPWPLVMLGEAGTGKTCAALCVIDWLANRKYWTMVSLCEELIAVQKGLREYGEQEDNPHWWWRRYKEFDCVVVDELAARDKVSDFQYETLKRAIDDRHGRPAIFISNLELSEIAKAYDDRIASRLAGGTIIRFTGGDRRLT